MGIVFITMPGTAKLTFAATLNNKTEGAVELVIVQKTKKPTFRKSLVRAKKMLKKGTILKETWYGLLLRISPKMRGTLTYFRNSNNTATVKKDDLPKILEVDSINTNEVYEILKKLSPELIVVSGGKIIQPHILATAKKSINLHIGRCPDYRGVLANQHAVLDNDFSGIGATVHYLAPEVDAGDIITIISADLSKKPQDLFADLNDKAQETFIDIAKRIHSGENIAGTKQDTQHKHTILLEHWTPELRYKTAKRMHMWEQGKIKP